MMYTMVFPARLQVTTPNGTQFFQTPDEAMQWINHNAPELTDKGSLNGNPRHPRRGRRSRRFGESAPTSEDALAYQPGA